MNRIFFILAAMLLLVLLAACGSDPAATLLPTSIPTLLPTSTPTPLPPTSTPTPQINKVSFTAVDYGFNGPASISAGMTTITLVNEGQELHHQQLVKLAEGMTAQDLLGALDPEAEGPPPGISISGGVAALAPGVTGQVTLNLEVGNYIMVCFIPDTNGVPHVALGMVTPLAVTEATGPLVAEPPTDLELDMFDFGFGLSAPIASGSQTIGITNTGQQDHEAFLVQLDPGVTAMEFVAAVEPGAPPGRPPGLALGGFQAIDPGGRSTFTVDFTTGNYALICFVNDPETGAPHFVLGMLEEFTVQ